MLDYKVHPFIFGLYRIALGGFILLYILLMSNRWIEFYGPIGISPVKLLHEFTFYRFSILSYLHTSFGLWVYYASIVIMLVALILGRWGKMPAVFIWLAMISIQNSNSGNVDAEEFVLVLFSFYAVVMPINSTLVFDFKKRRFTNSQKAVPAWTLLPFFVHMELIYIISLPLKPYYDHAWVDGTLVYLAASTFDMARFTAPEILRTHHAIVSKIMTWASLVVEGLFPILVWTRRFRVLMILSMVGFQIGIALLLSGVQMFSLSMLIALILFLPSKTTHDFFINPKREFHSWLRMICGGTW